MERSNVERPNVERPNVIVVLTDDQGYGDLGCHGNTILKTPNIDRFYAQSVRLTNYHVGPTCAPTRAGLLTGHYANSTGVWHTIGGRSLLRKDEISMADFFARAGYATGIFGKWHLGDNYPYRPQDRGFQEVVVHAGGGIGNTADYWGNNYFDDTYWTGDDYRAYSGYCTDIWFNEGLNFIERHKDEPFFCYIPTNAPHSPHLVAPEYSNAYLAETPDAERAKFYGMITNIDENFGILRQKLDEWDLAENTILIFMTDNGSAGGVEVDTDHFVTDGFNAGMRGKKNSEYDGGHRVPFFLHWPAAGLDQAHDVAAITANVDILPTLLDLCGVADWQQHDFDGRSLAPLLPTATADSTPWPDRAMVTDSQRVAHPQKWRKSAVMTDRWRLINGSELYDMDADPGQRSDVAAAHPTVVAELRKAYAAWWTKVSRQFDEEIPITIGDAAVPAVMLSSHDWRNAACENVWNQCEVRAGLQYNGYWEIEVANAGTYRIELRRWPREEDRAISAGIAGPLVNYGTMSLESGYGGGTALAITEARLRVGAVEQRQHVAPDARSVIFTLELGAGPTHLHTYFSNDADLSLGAYYVYIERDSAASG